MKKLILSLLCSCSIFILNAQVDVKINPIALLFTGVQVGADFSLQENSSIDADIIIVDDVFYSTLAGKYYFNPKIRSDGFHIGGFIAAGNEDIGVGVGFLGGYKWLSNTGKVLFELGLGVGRGTGDAEFVGYGKLQVGYRFGSTGKKE